MHCNTVGAVAVQGFCLMSIELKPDVRDAAVRLVSLLLGQYAHPTESDYLLAEQALAAEWRAGFQAHQPIIAGQQHSPRRG